MTGYEYLQAEMVDAGDECIEWPYSTVTNGYGKVKIAGKTRGVHVVALELTTPRPAGKVCSVKGNWVEGSKLQAAHGPCHNRLCFNPRHLSWKTNAENQRDKKRDGTNLDGERNHKCKLTGAQCAEIIARYKGKQKPGSGPNTGPTLQELGDEFGISDQQVSYIVRGKSRKVA